MCSSILRSAARVLATGALLATAACSNGSTAPRAGGITVRDEAVLPVGPAGAGAWILPNGRRIEPFGSMVNIDGLPLTIVLSPDGGTLFVTSNNDDGRLAVSALETANGAILSSIEQPAGLYLGLALAPDGRTLYAGGGGAERVVILDWDGATLTERGTIPAGEFPAGLALNPDGSVLFTLTQSGNGLTAFDTASGAELGRTGTGGNPYAIAVSPDGAEAFVSSEKNGTVDVFDVHDPRSPRQVATIPVQKNPEALVLSRDGTRLYVANSDEDSLSTIDVRKRKVLSTLDLRTLNSVGYGTGPNGLAFSPDGTRLYVAQAADNRVAVVDLAEARVVGAVPTAWYPTAVAVSPDGRRLFVANGKGTGTGPSDGGRDRLVNQATVQLVDVPPDAELARLATRADELAARSARLYDVNPEGFDNPIPRERGGPTPIEHVFLVVRENKTYDALLGDFPGGKGKPENCLYCGDPTPNLRALVERFASSDNYYSNAETSDQGHQILTSAISNVYVEKNRFASDRPVPFEAEIFLNPAVWPKRQYLFQALLAKQIPFRIYGEAVGTWIGKLIFDARYIHSSPVDPPFFWQYTRDIDKIEGRIAEWEDQGVPPFVYMLLPDDHTLGCESPYPTPRSMVADNDLATGRFVDWLTHSKYWKTSVAFIVEDDPQSGDDHVDAHRSIFVAVSPYARRGHVSHVIGHEGSLLATVEHLLGLDPLTIYDELAQPMWDLFTSTPDLEPYELRSRLVPEEISMPGTNCGFATRGLNFLDPDQATGLAAVLGAHEREARAAANDPSSRWRELVAPALGGTATQRLPTSGESRQERVVGTQ